jgi:hypothetical protein
VWYCRNQKSPDKSLTPETRLHDDTVLALFGLTSFLTLLDLGNHTLKGLADVLIESGACFCPATIELFSQFTAVFSLDLALLGTKIGLVANNDERD